MARIYIADDDADIRNLVTFWLIEEGHEVLASKDGQAALETIVEDPPDVVVLDLMMPNLDGFGVLQGLTDAGVRDQTRVLVLTARSAESDRVEGFDRGADLYLTKPFEDTELIGAINELLDSPSDVLAARREEEKDKAHLLAQLDAMFGGSLS